MARPLIQKLCGFCVKSFTTAPSRKNCLCPTCSEDKDVLKYHVEHEDRFVVRILGAGNSSYEPKYGGTPIYKGNVIGYVSPHTDIFFIGRIKRVMGPKKFLVSPIDRVCETPVCGDHSVEAEDIKCVFVYHNDKTEY